MFFAQIQNVLLILISLNIAYKTLIFICPAQFAKRRFVVRGLVPARLGIETDQWRD